MQHTRGKCRNEIRDNRLPLHKIVEAAGPANTCGFVLLETCLTTDNGFGARDGVAAFYAKLDSNASAEVCGRYVLLQGQHFDCRERMKQMQLKGAYLSEQKLSFEGVKQCSAFIWSGWKSL